MRIKTAWYIALVVTILHFLPYILYPGNAYIRIHDTLEGEWIWLDILDKSNTAVDFNPSTKVEQVMNGLPRSAMPTGISVMMLLVNMFGTYWGYIINYCMVHLIGFAAMYFFLQTHIFKREDDKPLIIYVSLIFSLIPVYSPFGLSVMSQPTLIHIFILALKNQARYYHYILLVLFPFYSSLVWMGIPLIMLLGLFWMYKMIKYRMIFPQYILGIIILTISYALVNINMFQLMLFPPEGFISHRKEYNLYLLNPPKLGGAMADFAHQIFTMHYHVGTTLTLPILILGIIVYKSRHPFFKKLFILVISIVVFQAFYGYFEYYIGSHIDFIQSFRFNRFNIVLPTIWLAALALIYREMQQSDFLKKLISISVFTLIITTSLGNDELLHNYRRIFGTYHLPPFKTYMATSEFDEIKKSIGKNPFQYRVAALGMNTAILQYNGFYTLDGLQSVYDLNYKKKFRKVFAAEIEKDLLLKWYFDGWGNRCYIFSSELGIDWISNKVDYSTYSSYNIELNGQAFKDLGGEYIISPYKFIFTNQSFSLVQQFNSKEWYWNLYLYKVNE